MATKTKMTDEELGALVDNEIRQSVAYAGSKLSEMRRKSEYYYLGEPIEDLAPPAIPGRSRVVSTDVSDTIEWVLPALMEIFTAGDNVVEFKERREDQEEAAEQTTDVCNYVFYQQNPGWAILYDWLKDGLLQKNGFLKVWWEDKIDETREEYRDLTLVQMSMLLQDPEVEPIEHAEYPDMNAMQAVQAQYQLQVQQYQQAASQAQASGQPFNAPPPQQRDMSQIPTLHAVTLKRTRKNGKVCIENVPPEEFIVSRRCKRIGDSPCGHRSQKTLSDLTARGYKNVDALSSDSDGDLNGERIQRMSWDDDYAWSGNDSVDNLDPTQRMVWVNEMYVQVDYDGDGIAEWRKVTRVGNTTLDNVECDGPAFVTWTPIRLPHRLFGLSLADLSMEAQRTKTAIWRGILDNIYFQLNARTKVVEGQVNIDDLLTNRPGGIVRMKQLGAVEPLQQGLSDSGSAYQALEAADAAKQDRTGVTKYTQGSDADTLNKTKGGLENITNRADMRVKLIARVMAETGMKDLFRMIQKLLSQYQDRAMTLKLREKWVDVDPRAWKNEYDMTVNVGLGTGDKSQVIQHLTFLGQAQQQALQIGVSTPENIYNTLKKIPGALGYKNADEFFTDPKSQPPQPPKPDPEMAKIQMQHQYDMQELQQKQQNVIAQNAAEAARRQAELDADIALRREEMMFKYGIHPALEGITFVRTYQQTTGVLNGSGDAGAQPAAGIGPGPVGSGPVGEPAPAGGVPIPAGGIQGSVGQQPGAGQ